MLNRILGAIEAYEQECAEIGKRISSLRALSTNEDVLALADDVSAMANAATKFAQQLRRAARDVRD